MIPTVSVTCESFDQNGNPIAGARFEAKLDRTEIYDGFVVPEKVTAIADTNGVCVLELWPNALGANASSYAIKAWNTDTGKRFIDTTAVVPNSDCRLEQIIVAEPYPALDAAQQALIAAQGALAPVMAQAQAAADSALVAQDAEDGALAAETAAQASAAAALASQQAAAISQTSASSSATTATGAAQTATQAADAAVAARDVAQAAATTATAQATAAGQRAQAADSSADAAALSKAAAAGSESAAQGHATAAAASANTAQAQATAAQQAKIDAQAAASTAQAAAAQAEDSADAAAGQAGLAISAANNASGYASTAGTHAATATTKAGEASASASLATTKAGEASTSAAAAAADRVQTGLDRVATAADREQTGMDAATATEQAGIATAKATESAAFAGSAQDSANAAASAVVSQLTDLKNQTEYARDQALAGLGAADNSQSLAALLGAIAYVTDLALKGAEGVAENRGTFRETDRAELYALMFGELLGKIGVIGRAVAGGAIALGAGAAGNPSLARLTDENTGLFFPAADVLALATAGLERLRITADGRLGLGTATPTGVLDVADNKLRVRTAQTPASATAAGNQGEIAWDANFVYVCTATNTWRRAALSGW